MKYVQEPKPVEYDPLTIALLEEQGSDWMGPIAFRVSPASHEKTVGLLNHNTTSEPVAYHHLLPSELWGCARVLSNYFGRLNEVAVSRARWEFSSSPFPDNGLYATSRIIKTERRKELSYATIETITYSKEGRTTIDHMRQLDELLLLHEAPDGFYKEREVKNDAEADLEILRRVYFRHNWNNGIWKNNVHTDEYARRFGYERALPEFIMYMDWVFDAFIRKAGMYTAGLKIDIPLILPIYEKDEIKVKVTEKEDKTHEVKFVKGNVLRLKGNISVNR